ncbi:MAG: GMC family oxidoreductase [Bacteroidota bacterium]|nr:GMC family oxidoreductase [Bacteroidota bacterium]MDP4254177.1 GMC family oxidoreductase [Bacteroidota bacterium]MDP4258969.1 GMC family oxidoreductase [Bacteroidota bacterium]
MDDKNTYDAIVVGSGITGGWAAKELTESGLKTLVLERGRNVVHGKDYPTANLAPWELPHGNEFTLKEQEEYAIQKHLWIVKPDTKHFFVKDTDFPYEQVKPFHWFRGYQVGGKSLMWSRHTFRWSDLDFEANAREGIGIDWPIRYRDIEPWYDYVERFIGVSGQNEGLSQLPDQQLLPPHEMNCLERTVKERLSKAYNDRVMIVPRIAVLTQPHNGRGACQSRNLCARGCPFGAYFSSNSSTLPAATRTGNLTLRPFSIVHSLIYDEKKNRAIGVQVIDAETREMHEYRARVIFLNGSTLNSTLILMNSVSSRFPHGFANTSGVLGRYLMDHQTAGAAYGIWEGDENKYYAGRKPNGMYIPRFRNVHTKHPDFLRGYAYECYSGRDDWSRGKELPGIGADYKKEMTEPGRWHMYMEGYGECLPYESNGVTLDPEKKDPWGMPILKVDMQFRENEMKMKADMQAASLEMMEKSGFKEVNVVPLHAPPGATIHEMGTARMGNDPRNSVLNKFNQTHDVPNVFVTDGSCMVSTACQNPSLTYMALTARACHHAVEEMKKGNI